MRIPLTIGSYQARSIIADAQRCLNLYPEINPKDAPSPFTFYPRPGLQPLADLNSGSGVRGLYAATNGDLYAVSGRSVYYVSANFSVQFLGLLTADLSTPVSMADNGVYVMLVDGTAAGYTISMADRSFGTIVDDAFYGANFVQYTDTYFVLNRPGYPTIYISGSNDISFDPLDFASKTGSPDKIEGIQIFHREVWLIGSAATEVWYNTGSPDFTFGPIPGVYIEHGCCARHSIAKQDMSVYWLSQDQQGHLLVVEGAGYKATRISTHAIEQEIQSYAEYTDAIGFTYQFQGHTVYHLTFPSANKTWIYDASTGLWHEQSWTDTSGVQHRHRANCAAFCYGVNIVGDWENSKLYALDTDTYVDDGKPIVFLKSFPHIQQDGKRLTHKQFTADMEVGRAQGTTPSDPPMVSLRWSDTRGASWGNPVQQSLGAAGEYFTSIQFQRLGMARDRVYELSWSVPYKTALNGAWLATAGAGS